MEVNLAGIEDLEEVSNLFDRYRVFYRQASDIEAARSLYRSLGYIQDEDFYHYTLRL